MRDAGDHQLRQKGGNTMAQVTRETTIAEVLRIDAETAPIFMGFGMHCLGCPSATGESLEDACAAHGIDADALVGKLNEYLASK